MNCSLKTALLSEPLLPVYPGTGVTKGLGTLVFHEKKFANYFRCSLYWKHCAPPTTSPSLSITYLLVLCTNRLLCVQSVSGIRKFFSLDPDSSFYPIRFLPVNRYRNWSIWNDIIFYRIVKINFFTFINILMKKILWVFVYVPYLPTYLRYTPVPIRILIVKWQFNMWKRIQLKTFRSLWIQVQNTACWCFLPSLIRLLSFC